MNKDNSCYKILSDRQYFNHGGCALLYDTLLNVKLKFISLKILQKAIFTQTAYDIFTICKMN